MNAFETVVSELLWNEGYWVRTSFKVELTKEEKRKIGRSSSPRWEIDILGYRAQTNELLFLECKSYLDSPGVSINGFDPAHKDAQRYKLFNDDNLRSVVFSRAEQQLLSIGACREKPNTRLGLACGNIRSRRDEGCLKELFKERDWLLWDPAYLRSRLTELSRRGYENEVSSVVSKLLLRPSAK